MRNGKMLETILLAGGFLLMVLCVYAYVKKEDNDFAKYAQETKDLRLMNEEYSKRIGELQDSQKSILSLIEKYSKELEVIKTSKAPIAVKVVDPININVFYKEITPRPLLPKGPPQKHSGGGSLLEKAGVR